MTRTKIAILLAAAGVAITGGSAYTAGLTNVPATTYIGSTHTTISGVAATTITYTYDATYTHIDAIAVKFTGDIHASHLLVVPTGGNASGVVDCGTGTYNNPTTDYTCNTSVTPADWPVLGLTDIRFTITS